MKQLVYLSIFSFVQLAAGMDALWIDEEDKISISSFTQSIQQRYYYLARLEQVHTLIQSIQKSSLGSSHDVYSVNGFHALHPRIVVCVKEVERTCSFEPLFVLWQELKSYKYLSDSDCLAEYAAFVCIIAQQLLTTLREHLSHDDQKTISALLTSNARIGSELVNSHEVSYRYYILKRLKNVTSLLKQCSQVERSYTLCSTIPLWTDARITKCAQDIDDQQSLNPILSLIYELEHYNSVENSIFIQELLELILFIEQHTLAAAYLPKQRELCAHYEHPIEGLSIEELLKSIDILTSHIDPYAFGVGVPHLSITSVNSLATAICAGILAWYASHALGVVR